MTNTGRLLISCPDRPGIVASLAQFLYERNANITHSDQHSSDPSGGVFFMRIQFEMEGLTERFDALQREFADVAKSFEMKWRMERAAKLKRLAVLVSREEHCLLELIWQQRSGDLKAEIAMVIGNHKSLGQVAQQYSLPFYHVDVKANNKSEAEKRIQELISGKVDAIILARYMQILSTDFIKPWEYRVINIHHSFLPAFVGAKPYQQAYDRGVKLIGATAHYVTADLDAGPIIEQDVHRVDHRHDPEDLRRIGRQIERVVLARAVSWHVEDKILVLGNKTVVFA